MNGIDHLLRRDVLSGAASVSLISGTAEDLYPLANIYSGRPGIPFRSKSTTIKIRFDLGATPITMAAFAIIGGNFCNLAAGNINLTGGATPGATTYNVDGSPFGVLGDGRSDWFSSCILQPVFWYPNKAYQYWDLTLVQTGRLSAFTQIGQIWIEPSGSYSWRSTSVQDAANPTDYSWPGLNDAYVDLGRAGVARGSRIAINNYKRLYGDGPLASWIEGLRRNSTLVLGADYINGGVVRSASFTQSRELRTQGNIQIDTLIQGGTGDGVA